MDESDLFRLLSYQPIDCLDLRVKESGVKTELVKDFLLRNKAPIIGGTIGAATLGLGSYLTSKRSKEGDRSTQQRISDAALSAAKKHENEFKNKGRKPSFSARMATITARTTKDLSDLYADHPGKAGLAATVPGALLGLAATKLIRR